MAHAWIPPSLMPVFLMWPAGHAMTILQTSFLAPGSASGAGAPRLP
jgi:hypothetical protein